MQGSLLLPTCAWWRAGAEGIPIWSFLFSTFCIQFHNLFSVQVFTTLFSAKVDQNLDFMCEVEDGWWKGRVGGRVSWINLEKVRNFAFWQVSSVFFAQCNIQTVFRLVSSPPTLSRCVKMTQPIQSNPVQKQSRNYPYLQRFENNHFHQRIEKYHYRQRFENSMTGKDVLSLALFRRLSSCLHHWRKGLLLLLWRLKTRRILSEQTGEQLFVFFQTLNLVTIV